MSFMKILRKQLPKTWPVCVSVPRTQAVYCENCDTVSNSSNERCVVCNSVAVTSLSKLVQFAAEPPRLIAAPPPVIEQPEMKLALIL